MSPTEFAVRMIAADRRFAQALKRDDIRDMRAALAEKTGLLEAYFAATRRRARDEAVDARSTASF
jgi:Tfp pilus assembly protein PilE